MAITRSERNKAHRLIEEFMLAANETVAAYLEHTGMEMLHRIHEQPEIRKVIAFEQIAAYVRLQPGSRESAGAKVSRGKAGQPQGRQAKAVH